MNQTQEFLPRWLKTWFALTFIGTILWVIMEWPRGRPRPLIMALLILGWMAAVRYREAMRQHLRLGKRGGAILCVLIGWVVGMALELSITGTAGKPGGFAADPINSFLAAQGYYWTYPLLALLLIRRFHFTYWEIFFAAGLVSIIETFILGVISALLSPLVVLAPFIFAFYVTLYGVLISIPLLFVDEKIFWDSKFTPISRIKAFIITFLILGAGNWLIFGAWSFLIQSLGVDVSGAI